VSEINAIQIIRSVEDFKNNINPGDEFFVLTTEYSKPNGIQKCMLMDYLGCDSIAEQIQYGPIGKPNQKAYLYSFWATRFGGVVLSEEEAEFQSKLDIQIFNEDKNGLIIYHKMKTTVMTEHRIA
jgi:hypothetical protein